MLILFNSLQLSNNNKSKFMLAFCCSFGPVLSLYYVLIFYSVPFCPFYGLAFYGFLLKKGQKDSVTPNKCTFLRLVIIVLHISRF